MAWRPADDETGATAFRLAYDSGGGMFQAVSLDLSSYIAANGIYKFIVKDCSGNAIIFYGASACGGESFGTDLVTDGDMESDPTNNWTARDCSLAEETTDVHGGSKALEVTDTAGGDGEVRQDISITVGKLYKFIGWYKKISSNAQLVMYMFGSPCINSGHLTQTSWTEYSAYATGVAGGGGTRVELRVRTDGMVALYDDVSFKPLTDLPATAINMESTPGAGDGNYASKDSGFDPNDICSFKVWRLVSMGGSYPKRRGRR